MTSLRAGLLVLVAALAGALPAAASVEASPFDSLAVRSLASPALQSFT